MFNIPKTLPAFIWHFAKQYKMGLAIVASVALVWSADLVVRPYMLKMMIDNLVNESHYQNILKALLFPTLSYIAMLIILNIAFCLLDYFSLKIFPKLKSSISLEIMKYLELHSYEFFQNHLGGSLANRVYDLTNGSEKIIQLILNNFLPSSLVLITTGIALFLVHPYFAFVMYIWVIVFFSINVMLSKNFENLANVFSASRNNLMGKIVDSITNINNVRLFARTQYEIDIIDEQLKDVIIKEEKVGWSFLFIHFFQNSLTIVLTVVLIILLIVTKQKNLITVGDFVLVITLSFSISDAVKILSRSYTDISKEIGICKQALNAINFSHSISDKPDASLLKVTDGKIIFKNVSFFYSENNNIFKNQTFNIAGRKKVGLVGYSGSGKSTLVNLITRLFDLKDGQILIDDQDIADVTQDSLRNNIGFIPQDPILFHRSIIENIRYGNLNATDEEVFEAARKAHAHEFIMSIPGGYTSLVGERGVKLSAGQRQRIAIARAILKNAPILILDEATSSLDSLTESLIQDSFKTLMKDKTVIVIAHRLSTLLIMDKIMVLDKGKIVEEGEHSKLIKNNGLYSHLWYSQIGGFLPNNGLLENNSNNELQLISG